MFSVSEMGIAHGDDAHVFDLSPFRKGISVVKPSPSFGSWLHCLPLHREFKHRISYHLIISPIVPSLNIRPRDNEKYQTAFLGFAGDFPIYELKDWGEQVLLSDFHLVSFCAFQWLALSDSARRF